MKKTVALAPKLLPKKPNPTTGYTLRCACGEALAVPQAPGKDSRYACARCNSPVGKRKRTLERRKSEFYKYVDGLSRLPLEENKEPWDELVLEISGERFYEHLPLLVAIIQEGQWRTEASHLKSWLLGAWRNQVRKVQEDDDYCESGKRRPSGPKFDNRNGALIRPVMRPFAEFTISNEDGDEISGLDAIERGASDSRGEPKTVPRAASREDLKFLGGLTVAERFERIYFEEMLYKLNHQRSTFNRELKAMLHQQRSLVARLGLDADEATAIAVRTLLWAGEYRSYLNFLDEATRKRMRNAFDRLDRRLKGEEWASLFRQTLKWEAQLRRAEWRKMDAKSEAEIDARLRAVQPQRPSPISGEPRPAQMPKSGGLIRFTQLPPVRIDPLLASFRDLLIPPLGTSLDRDAREGSRVVDIGFDLHGNQSALYVSSAKKATARRARRLYSE